MMRLCKKNLVEIAATTSILLPAEKVFQLPEKVLQFGTGVLLRGLTDFIIDNANKNNIFNGRIVVVKSTTTGDTAAFDEQDGLYTLCVRGIEDGKKVEENILVASISRVLSAAESWGEILDCATNPDVQIIVSNTTEVGLTLVQDDVNQQPPVSFPGKLLAFLYARFIYCKGDVEKGFVIIPTELIPGNGKLLKDIIFQLAAQNNMEAVFIDWIENANSFCSSLVDRIVPGKMQAADKQKEEAALSYTDDLMIIAEPYYLWAIETDTDKVRSVLSFAQNNHNVVLAANIDKYRELKLRLLNGAHTFSCGLAYLAGFTIVKDAMQDAVFKAYIRQLMYEEIIPAICAETINTAEAEAFAGKVLDRFSNTFIEHKWLSITMQYSSKMTTRNAAVIKAYISRFNEVPEKMVLGMAAHILFMKGTLAADGKYYGTAGEQQYLINDDNAAFFSTAWNEKNSSLVAAKILNQESIWHTNVPFPKIFIEAVIIWLTIITTDGPAAAMLMINKKEKLS